MPYQHQPNGPHQPPYGQQPHQPYPSQIPPSYAPPQPPPRRDRDGGGNGRLMLILTLIGTVATVLSVLVAVGIGPFDLSDDSPASDGSDKNGAGPAASTQGPAKQTAESYVRAVNEVCLARSDNVTRLLNDLTASTVSKDVAQQRTALSAASAELKNNRSHIRAVPLPADPAVAGPFTHWRDAYDSRVDALGEAASTLNSGDSAGFRAASDRFVNETGPVKDKQRALNIACP